MNHRKTFIRTIAALAVTAAIAGCANQAQTQGAIGAGLGCAAGAAIASATGSRNVATGCVVGAAAGGALGYYKGRQADLELARSTANAINTTTSAGVRAAINTRQETVAAADRSSMGGASSVEAVDTMVVNIPNTLVTKRDDRASQTLSRVGGYVSSAQTPSQVTIKAKDANDYDFMLREIRAGYASKTSPEPSKVQYRFEQVARGSQSTVEVAHPARSA